MVEEANQMYIRHHQQTAQTRSSYDKIPANEAFQMLVYSSAGPASMLRPLFKTAPLVASPTYTRYPCCLCCIIIRPQLCAPIPLSLDL